MTYLDLVTASSTCELYTDMAAAGYGSSVKQIKVHLGGFTGFTTINVCLYKGPTAVACARPGGHESAGGLANYRSVTSHRQAVLSQPVPRPGHVSTT